MEKNEEKSYMSMTLPNFLTSKLRKFSKENGVRINFVVEKAVIEYFDNHKLDTPAFSNNTLNEGHILNNVQYG